MLISAHAGNVMRRNFANDQDGAVFGYLSVTPLQRHEEEGVNHDALLAGLLPDVIPVPAMIVAINRAQETGLS